MEKAARTVELKVVAIGNSRGVRLPKALLEKYAIKNALVLEERREGLLLRSKHDTRLSWEDTFREMALAREDWSDFETAVADGLDREDKW
ncbi:MAG: AbrB/MazE/SpoVT family DNA-binding domain-containing protein [Burkholderiales bacterium]